MSEVQHFSLWNRYKVSAKYDQDIFNIKYQIGGDKNDDSDRERRSNSRQDDRKSGGHQQNYSKKGQFPTEEKTDQPKDLKEKTNKHHYIQKSEWGKKDTSQIQTKVSVDKYTNNVEKKSFSKKQDIEKGQIIKNVPLAQSSQIVQKKIEQKHSSRNFIQKTSLQVEHQDIYDENEQLRSTSERQLEKQRERKIKNQQLLFQEYIDIEQIQQSRDKNQKLYFRGRIQFSQQVKWSAKIISFQKEGYLIAEGKYLNRTLHEDQVYFTVIAQRKELIICSVVAIAQRRNIQIVGKIVLSKNNIGNSLLKPISKKIAKMNINQNQIKKEWIPIIESHYFVVQFVQWKNNQQFPICRIKEVFGKAGQIDIQSKAMLKTNGIDQIPCTQYQQAQMEKLFSESFIDNKFCVPQKQIKKRRDFRKWKTFIIKDSVYDIAISIFPLTMPKREDPNFLKKNVFEINIHFTDVAFFVNQSSFLDEFLFKKMTVFNLIHRSTQFLPHLISRATKLQLNKDILTISVGIQIDQEGILADSIKITKSVISPKCTVTLHQLQRVITQKLQFNEWSSWNSGLMMQSEFNQFQSDVKLLYKLTSLSRSIRIEKGAFTFQMPFKQFKFDQNGQPQTFQLVMKNDADLLIEQCVILAQSKLGQYLLKGMKQNTVLYRHRFPGFKTLERLRMLAVKVGYPIDERSKSQIHKYINTIVADPKVKQCVKEVIKYEVIKLLKNADYFHIQNTDPTTWNNFAINIPLYARCSSPTKRYGDLLIQKQIVACLDNTEWELPTDKLNSLVERANKGILLSNIIRSQCEKVVLCHYLIKNAVYTTAVITEVLDWGIRVCVTKYGFRATIKFSKIPSIKITPVDSDFSSRKFVKIDFKSLQTDIQTHFMLKQLQEIDIQIKSSNTLPLSYLLTIVMPNPNDPSNKLLIK